MARIGLWMLAASVLLLAFYGCTGIALPQVLPVEGHAGRGVACVIMIDNQRVAATPAHVLFLAGTSVTLGNKPLTHAKISTIRDLALLDLSEDVPAVPSSWRFRFQEEIDGPNEFPFDATTQSNRCSFSPGDSGFPVISGNRHGLFAGRDQAKNLYLATNLQNLTRDEWEVVQLADLALDFAFLQKIDGQLKAFADFLQTNPTDESAQNHFLSITNPVNYSPHSTFSAHLLKSRAKLYRSIQQNWAPPKP